MLRSASEAQHQLDRQKFRTHVRKEELGIGDGGMGFNNMTNIASEDIVALCDVDQHHAAKAFEKLEPEDIPAALAYASWRAEERELPLATAT